MSNKDDLDKYLDSIPGMPGRQQSYQQQQPTQRQDPMNRDIDVTNMLMQRLAAQGQPGMHQHQHQQQPQVVGQSHQACYIRDGAPFYKAIPAEMSPVPVAIKGGPINGMVGKECTLGEARKYLVVDQQNTVDLSNPDYNNMQVLYVVDVPWQGKILVPESAVVKTGNQGKQLLKG